MNPDYRCAAHSLMSYRREAHTTLDQYSFVAELYIHLDSADFLSQYHQLIEDSERGQKFRCVR